jgi:hypothetical protein
MNYDGGYDFGSNSIKDLVEARDQYHFHLMSKANVVGTAIGSYLIRDADPQDGSEASDELKKIPRTFFNSHVRPYSWPCIIVLVRKWLQEGDFGPNGKAKPWQILPKTLYLPDGRAVPVCTVLAAPVAADQKSGSLPTPQPSTTFGGGVPLHVNVQGEDRFGTTGCLVSDGHLTYALTARHVCGEAGTPVMAGLRGRTKEIGVSAEKQLTRKLFSEVYPGLPMRQTWLGIDAGLVKLEQLEEWTPNIYGLPPLRPMLDLYEQNMSLKIIDNDVVAAGAASGLLRGKIKALFYRYRSAGGFDYVSDFLISPNQEDLGARHGDSGAVWQIADMPTDKNDNLPPELRPLRPLALEWGAQVFSEGNQRSSFSVASSLSTICRLLGVDLVIPGDDNVSGTWGAVGHYSIGRLATGLVKNAKLKDLMQANIDAISLGLDVLADAEQMKQAAIIGSGFVPLADVADIIWKKYAEGHTTKAGKENGIRGGRDVKFNGTGGSTGPEHPQHHCDADGPFQGKPTLREACLANPDLLSTSAWIAYYESKGPRTSPDYKSGILPFRIWQYFGELKKFAATDLDAFVATAGTLAHYIGDASQPLHGSSMHDGDQDRIVEGRISKARSKKDKTTGEVKIVMSYWGEGVHSKYESELIDYAAKNNMLFPEIEGNLDADHELGLVSTGRDAGIATLELMDKVANILSPSELADIFENNGGFENSKNAFMQVFWEATKTQTGQVMALGARYLAMIWDSAWEQGGGDTNRQSELGLRNRDNLKSFYEDPKFVQSYTIDEIGPILGAEGDFSGHVPAMRPATPTKKSPGKKPAKKPAKKLAKKAAKKPRKPRKPANT